MCAGGNMDILKDLPIHDKDNFSRFSQGCFRNCSVRNYIRLKSGDKDENAQVIVTDTQSLLLREMEKEASRKRRISLKRGHVHTEQQGGRDRKVPRTESDDDSPVDL